MQFCFCSVARLAKQPRFHGFPLENWEGHKKDPGISWLRDQQTPENLGCNKLAVTR